MSEHPEAIAHYPKSTQLLIKRMYNRTHRENKNILAVVVGPTGVSKSYSALSLMVGLYLYSHGKLSSDEEIIRHLCFRALDFMKEINSMEETRGIWCWDESGVDANAQDFMTIKNKIISQYAQTCRNLNQTIFFTLPAMSMLTSQVRMLLHFYLEVIGVDKKNKLGVLKPFELQYNPRYRKGEPYFHRIRIITKEGKVRVIKLCGVPLVHKSLIEAYEKKKKEFTQGLNIQIQQKLQKMEDKENKDNKPVDKRIELSYQEIYILYHTRTKLQQELARLLNVSQPAINKKMKIMDRDYPSWKENPNMLGDLSILTRSIQNQKI